MCIYTQALGGSTKSLGTRLALCIYTQALSGSTKSLGTRLTLCIYTQAHLLLSMLKSQGMKLGRVSRSTNDLATHQLLVCYDVL